MPTQPTTCAGPKAALLSCHPLVGSHRSRPITAKPTTEHARPRPNASPVMAPDSDETLRTNRPPDRGARLVKSITAAAAERRSDCTADDGRNAVGELSACTTKSGASVHDCRATVRIPAIASAIGRGQRSEQVDIGARLVRQRLADSKVRFITRRAGIVGSQEPGSPYRSCSSRRYAAPATMLS